MKKVNSQSCSFCRVETETIEHLFFNLYSRERHLDICIS